MDIDLELVFDVEIHCTLFINSATTRNPYNDLLGFVSVAGVMGNPLGTVNFNSWEELNNHINNNMPNYTCQFFTSAWKAFDGQGFYGNLVQGFLIRVLTDNYLLFGIAQDGRLVFRRGNTTGWEAAILIL